MGRQALVPQLNPIMHLLLVVVVTCVVVAPQLEGLSLPSPGVGELIPTPTGTVSLIPTLWRPVHII